jgi:bifunctional N-acetylglucosamine-1-phosphate-uridyltransferase/glucosamine-1-phosphate-acetyltransferase GlmU-like protein
MNPTLVVLAAGMGSRYGSLKQIDQFGPSNETIIDYSIFDAIRAGFSKVIFIIRKEIEEEFKEVFGGKFGNRIEVDYVFQELDILPDGIKVPKGRKKPWGTGHAVMLAADKVSDPFAVINGDDFYGTVSFQLLHNFLVANNPEELNGCLIGYQLKNTLSDHGHVSRGICDIAEDQSLEAVNERARIFKGKDEIYYEEDDQKHPLTGNEIVSMNLMGFTPPFFKVLREGFEKFVKNPEDPLKSEYYLPAALSSMIRDHHVKVPVIKTPEMTYGVTYQADKDAVRNMILEKIAHGIYPKQLWDQ